MDILIIGAGGGNISTYTQEALEALQDVQVILGAERILAGPRGNFAERRHRVLFRLQISCRKNERPFRIRL